MKNGLQKINLFFVFILFFYFSNNVFSEDVQLGPLINLDQIEPSYEDIEEYLNIDESDEDDSNKSHDEADKKKYFVSLNVLNKITANVQRLDIELKENFNYGELRIYAIDCYSSGPDEKQETAVYLNIYHNSKDKKLFSGWMLKSLPSISSIEHPIYDIWVNDCF